MVMEIRCLNRGIRHKPIKHTGTEVNRLNKGKVDVILFEVLTSNKLGNRDFYFILFSNG